MTPREEAGPSTPACKSGTPALRMTPTEKESGRTSDDKHLFPIHDSRLTIRNSPIHDSPSAIHPSTIHDSHTPFNFGYDAEVAIVETSRGIRITVDWLLTTDM